ncbi:MAG TPA: DMT family transporter [Actinomycetes bacterium]|jgi:drug/metabolite transporter (DMT)-like permease|nr:DMT family transporter [Actinomycetes bacterium]
MSLGPPLGLGSGLLWGTGDFVGGVQSRRQAPRAVAMWSQVAGAVVLLGVLASRPGDRPALAGVVWGVVGGLGGGCGLLLFYRGLAEGAMSIVAPVAACGAIVPVTVAFARGTPPSLPATIGIAAALAGVVLLSRTPRGERHAGVPLRVVAMALGAALGFGFFFVCVDAGSAVPGGSPLWVVAGARAGSLTSMLVIALAGRRSVPWPGRHIWGVALAGVLDTAANVLFAYATTMGNLGVVGVLGSLYPVTTVLLARFVLAERLSGVQATGVGLALTGVALLGAG